MVQVGTTEKFKHYTNQDTNSNVKNGKLFLRAVKRITPIKGLLKIIRLQDSIQNLHSNMVELKFELRYPQEQGLGQQFGCLVKTLRNQVPIGKPKDLVQPLGQIVAK